MNSKYHIVVDENMPGVDMLFNDSVTIKKINGRAISRNDLIEADALFCRSITNVNRDLLDQTKVSFVGTATIGTDHIDINWLKENTINWANATGCNAAAVAQYVLSGISYWCLSNNREIRDLTVGIVGAGSVGTELSRCLDTLGIKYLQCDPPLQLQGDRRSFVDSSEILKCDVISLHVPLVKKGEHKTKNLVGESELKKLSSQQLLINASRGEVVNNRELDHYLKTASSAQVILDVFENEPNISASLVSQCLLATPHIAGHTLEGKLRGTWLIYQAFCRHFSIQNQHQEAILYPQKNQLAHAETSLEKVLLQVYNIQLDSNSLKEVPTDILDEQFDHLRKNATRLSNGMTRRDYSGWQLPPSLKALAN